MKSSFAHIERYRTRGGPYRSDPGELGGQFVFPYAPKVFLMALAASGAHPEAMGWDHVSVTVWILRGAARKPERAGRCPTWEEMCWIKDKFFDAEEPAFQLHPPRSQYVNHHPHCLHIWRKAGAEVETPPAILVGPKTN